MTPLERLRSDRFVAAVLCAACCAWPAPGNADGPGIADSTTIATTTTTTTTTSTSTSTSITAAIDPSRTQAPSAETSADSTPPSIASIAADRSWLAPDRHQHFSLSFAIGLGAGLASSSTTAAAICPLVLGIAKEARDARSGGRWDSVDLVADLLGTALAVWAVSRIDP